jgi:hypothetical protein
MAFDTRYCLLSEVPRSPRSLDSLDALAALPDEAGGGRRATKGTVRLVKLVRDRVSPKRTTTGTGRRKAPNQKFRGQFSLLCIVHRSESCSWEWTPTGYYEPIHVILRNQQAPISMMGTFDCRVIADVLHAVDAVK